MGKKTKLGAPWTKVSEVTLSTSYSMSVEDQLIAAASKELQDQIDKFALKTVHSVTFNNKYKESLSSGTKLFEEDIQNYFN